jgi:hypothetical protein
MINTRETLVLQIPESFTFGNFGLDDVERILSFFDWSLENRKVEIECSKNIQSADELLVLIFIYVSNLISRNCDIVAKNSVKNESFEMFGASEIVNNWDEIFGNQEDIKTSNILPLSISNSTDLEKALLFGEKFTQNLSIEYNKILRYVLNELLYNTLEHGRNGHNIPSLLQFFWNEELNELSFIIADVGVGIKKHLRQTYPTLATDVEAILHSIKPKVSGAIGGETSNYKKINNAGVGLYFSSNLVKKLKADMFIISGNGFVQILPTEIISKELHNQWKGTFVFVKLKLGLLENVSFEEMRLEIQEAIPKNEMSAQTENFYINLKNYFGQAVENKDLSKNIRDKYLLPALAENKTLMIDFEDIVFATDSALNAMLATPIHQLGLSAYKKIKVINVASDIRVMLDFIFDDNTSNI